jgi:hypothetical protein
MDKVHDIQILSHAFCIDQANFPLQIQPRVKVKVSFTIEQTTKSQKGSRGITLLFL